MSQDLRELQIPPRGLQAVLGLPDLARGLVVFAHGSGSGRLSARNRAVAGDFDRVRLATLLFDLLTEDEARIDAATTHLRFDVSLLSMRLLGATEWAIRQPETSALPLGYFGASTGAAAALVAAAERPEFVHAIVSRHLARSGSTLVRTLGS